MKLEE
jgi:hypothetical protein